MAPARKLPIPAEPLPLAADRWTIRRKASVIASVLGGRITLEDVYERYQLSSEEFASWLVAVKKHGIYGLRTTRFQVYRDLPKPRRPEDRVPRDEQHLVA
jgi:hypothetical protein